MSIYLDWGFSQNPFDTTALPATDTGRKLLVGRDKELAMLVRRLRNPPRIPTLEGPNGVGKTSLANVAAFVCYESYLTDGTGPFLIPCHHPFQLSPEKDVDAFSAEVLMDVAQTLIAQRELTRQRGRIAPNLKALDRWLNSAQVSGWQVSGGLFGGGVGVGRQPQASQTAGYERSGFRREVLSALSEIFGAGEGVVCVIDNLELLQASDIARRTLEQLRDTLLYVPGLRWIVAGAAGIVNGVASSPRLEGNFAAPIEVSGIDAGHAVSILTTRVEAFKATDEHEPYLPLAAEDFAMLYQLLAQNLRSALGRADDYCVFASDHVPTTKREKRDLFAAWLDSESRAAMDSVDHLLTKRAWQVLDRACADDLMGYFSPSSFEEFGFNATQNLRPYIKDLEAAGLVAVSRDDTDKRRKTIQVVAKGWFVNYARRTRL
jgi:hypothetical protein